MLPLEVSPCCNDPLGRKGYIYRRQVLAGMAMETKQRAAGCWAGCGGLSCGFGPSGLTTSTGRRPPPPLTQAEEAVIFVKLENNDESAKQELIVHNLRLVVYIARKFESTGIGVEDLISIGTIGLIKGSEHLLPQAKYQAGHLRFPLH